MACISPTHGDLLPLRPSSGRAIHSGPGDIRCSREPGMTDDVGAVGDGLQDARRPIAAKREACAAERAPGQGLASGSGMSKPKVPSPRVVVSASEMVGSTQEGTVETQKI